MLCDRESLFMNSTRLPTAICTLFGLTPDDVIVIVLVATGGAGADDGAVLEPPHPPTTTASTIARATRRLGGSFMLRSS
jgi:hypothetical protein